MYVTERDAHAELCAYAEGEEIHTVMWIHTGTHTQTDAQSERSTQEEKHTHEKYAHGESDTCIWEGGRGETCTGR
jgi:hypothetical protein